MRYLSIDLETTGLDPQNSQILEFGAVLEDTNNILPMDELPYYHAYIVPEKGIITGHIYALNMNASIIEKINNKNTLQEKYNFIELGDLTESFLFWLSSQGFKTNKIDGESINVSEYLNIAGKNFNGFDKLFLNNVPLWNKHIKMRHRVIDPAVLFVDWKNDGALPDLSKCKEKAGLDSVVSHLAIDDAKDVIRLLRKSYV